MLLQAVWCAGILLKAVAAFRMVRDRLLDQYLAVWVYVSFMVVHSTALFFLRPYWHWYLVTYGYGVPFSLLLKFGAVTSIFWALTSNYRDFRTWGSAILGVFAVFGVAGAWATSFLPATPNPGPWLWNMALAALRYASEVIVVVLLAARFLVPKSPRISAPRTAQRAAVIMSFDAALSILAAWFAKQYAYSMPDATAYVATASGIMVGAAWLTLRRFNEAPVYLPTPQELAESNRKLKQELHLISADIDYAIRKLDRD
jgi:hypothetical protein